MIKFLIKNRYRARFGSQLWLKYWGKRLKLLPQMISTEFVTGRIARKCQCIGNLTYLPTAKFNGPLGRLAIGEDCFIGRVEFHLHDTITIGDHVVVNDGSMLLTGTHNVHSADWNLIAKPIEIHSYAWIAVNAIVLPGVTIGWGAVVGAGAVVTKSVAPYQIVAGNPAVVVGTRASLEFSYRPNRSRAIVEAWLGPVGQFDE